MTFSVVDYGGARRPSSKRSVNVAKAGSPNSDRQKAALKKLSECELACGLSAEQLDLFHADQRAQVRARYGVSA